MTFSATSSSPFDGVTVQLKTCRAFKATHPGGLPVSYLLEYA